MNPGRAFASLLLLLLSGLSPPPAQGALLRLRAVGPEGAPATLERAQVLLVAWGDTRVVDLPVQEDLVLVDLSLGWLEAQEWRTRDVERAYLYLEAKDLAPVRSEPIHWIGAYGETPGEVSKRAEIRFPGSEVARVEPDTVEDLTVRLRRPEKRFLHLVDETGEPVVGLRVESSMFWSRSNHCGVVASARHHPLGAEVSDADGRIEVPDGDFEHAFVFDDGPYWPVHPDANDYLPPMVITRLGEEETEVVFHRFPPRRVEVWVTRGGEPVQGVELIGCRARCSCGACCGIEAEGTRGIFHLGASQPFYPEDRKEIWVVDSATRETLWKGDPTQWPEGDILRIELAPEAGESGVTRVDG